MIVSGHYSFGDVSVAVDDDLFGTRLKRVYGLEQAGESDASEYVISVAGASDALSFRCQVVVPLAEPRMCSSWEEVAGAIDGFFDKMIRAQVSPDLVTLHASSAVAGGKAIAFVGESGSGKTTLSLEFAHVANGYLGDEYAFYRPSTGACFHERHPVRLKRRDALEGVVTLATLSDLGVESFAFNPESVGLPQLLGAFQLGAIVFPNYSSKVHRTSVECVSLRELPALLLPSVAGVGDRADLFRVLISSFARYGVRLLRVRYSDSHDATMRIMEKLGLG